MLIRIKIRDLPADTVALSVERRRDMPRAWVRILANVRFFLFVPLRSFFCATLAKRWKVQLRHNLIMLIRKRHKKIMKYKNYYIIYI